MSAVVTAAHARLDLFDGFELRYDGTTVPLPMSAQRVVAFVALQDHAVPRGYVACKLWLESPEDHATSSLRSALWRLRQSGCDVIESAGRKLELAPHVAVDAHEAADWSRRMLDGRTEDSLHAPDGFVLGELLPDWYEDWVLLEREHFRQLRLQALERLAIELTAGGQYGRAVETALAAVASEPLRESAHRALISVHLAQGNRGEAIRQYCIYKRLMRDELDLEPSRQMDDLIGDVPDLTIERVMQWALAR